MKPYLSNFIFKSQCVPVRFIGYDTGPIYDVMHYLNTNDKAGLLINFEKVLDSIIKGTVTECRKQSKLFILRQGVDNVILYLLI